MTTSYSSSGLYRGFLASSTSLLCCPTITISALVQKLEVLHHQRTFSFALACQERNSLYNTTCMSARTWYCADQCRKHRERFRDWHDGGVLVLYMRDSTWIYDSLRQP